MPDLNNEDGSVRVPSPEDADENNAIESGAIKVMVLMGMSGAGKQQPSRSSRYLGDWIRSKGEQVETRTPK